MKKAIITTMVLASLIGTTAMAASNTMVTFSIQNNTNINFSQLKNDQFWPYNSIFPQALETGAVTTIFTGSVDGFIAQFPVNPNNATVFQAGYAYDGRDQGYDLSFYAQADGNNLKNASLEVGADDSPCVTVSVISPYCDSNTGLCSVPPNLNKTISITYVINSTNQPFCNFSN